MLNRSIAQWLSGHRRVAFMGLLFGSSFLLSLISSYAEQSIIDEDSVAYKNDNELDLIDNHHKISNISHSTMGTQKCPHQVCSHIRNLSDGRCPSSDKRKSAKELGFELSEHQTWVVSYYTGEK